MGQMDGPDLLGLVRLEHHELHAGLDAQLRHGLLRSPRTTVVQSRSFQSHSFIRSSSNHIRVFIRSSNHVRLFLPRKRQLHCTRAHAAGYTVSYLLVARGVKHASEGSLTLRGESTFDDPPPPASRARGTASDASPGPAPVPPPPPPRTRPVSPPPRGGAG